MTTVLVTGGAGYVGSHIVRYLTQNNYDIVVLDNLSTGHPEAIGDVPLAQGDIRDEAFVRSVFFDHSIDAVIHCAALALVNESIARPFSYYDVNVRGSLTLLKAMIESGVDTLVFSSTAAVYGEPVSAIIGEEHPRLPMHPYGTSKKIVEDILADLISQHLIRCVVLRYFNVAGAAREGGIGESHDPETHLIPNLLKYGLDQLEPNSGPFLLYGKDFPTPDGTCIRDFIHPTDLAIAHEMSLKYLDADSESVFMNIGCGRGYSVKEVVNTVKDLLDIEVPVEVVSRRRGDPSRLVADIAEARFRLGWKPSYSDLDTILKTAWNWHKENRY